MVNARNLTNYIIIFCIWFSAFVSLYSQTLNSFALYILLPIVFGVSVYLNNGLSTNKYVKILIFLILWIFFSYLWAVYKEPAERQLRQLLGVFIFSYSISIIVKNKKFIPYLYVSYFILLASAWLYAKNNILPIMASSKGVGCRLNDDILNANTLAYYTFYVTFSIYILAEIVQSNKIRKIWEFLFWLMIPLSMITAILTASRQVLLIQIPLISVFIYLRYWKKVNRKKKFVFALIVAICIMISMPKIISSYENSYLAKRSETSVQKDSRYELLVEAIDVGIEYFPFGVGANNFVAYSINKQFSHNIYAELFVNEGAVGLILYLVLLLEFLKKQWLRYKKYRDSVYFVFFIFGIIYALDGLFYVFYSHMWLIGFFILVASHSECYYKCQINNKL